MLKNAPPYLGHFLSNWTMNIPSTLAANIARFSDATSPTKSKQKAENAPFRSPIGLFPIPALIHQAATYSLTWSAGSNNEGPDAHFLPLHRWDPSQLRPLPHLETTESGCKWTDSCLFLSSGPVSTKVVSNNQIIKYLTTARFDPNNQIRPHIWPNISSRFCDEILKSWTIYALNIEVWHIFRQKVN